MTSGPVCACLRNTSAVSENTKGWSVPEKLCPRHKAAVYLTRPALSKEERTLVSILTRLALACVVHLRCAEAQVEHTPADRREKGDGLGRYTLTVHCRGCYRCFPMAGSWPGLSWADSRKRTAEIIAWSRPAAASGRTFGRGSWRRACVTAMMPASLPDTSPRMFWVSASKIQCVIYQLFWHKYARWPACWGLVELWKWPSRFNVSTRFLMEGCEGPALTWNNLPLCESCLGFSWSRL